MTNIVVTLVLDIILTGLLGVTIYFCWKLNGRIKILQDGKSELAQIIGHFDESTERAKASIIEIQNASKKITQNIQIKLEKANYLADDLSFMIEKGGKLADQMEANFSTYRKEKPLGANPIGTPGGARPQAMEAIVGRSGEKIPTFDSGATPSQASNAPSPRLRSKAEQDLIEALKSKG